MGVNKFIYGGQTKFDISSDTVTPNNLLSGATAHDASGDPIQGGVTVPEELDDLSDVNLTSVSEDDQLINKSGSWVNKKLTVELTQAEYDALEEAGTVDPDVEYHISNGLLAPTPVDDNDVSTEKTWSSKKISESQAIYSTDERVVGTWIDGKPLYQKTYNFGTLPNNNVKSIAHNIPNLDYVVKLEGTSYDGSLYYSIPNSPPSGINYLIGIYADAQNINIRTGIDRTSLTTTYVTMLYTKTTD